jgi:hypothetical protein
VRGGVCRFAAAVAAAGFCAWASVRGLAESSSSAKGLRLPLSMRRKILAPSLLTRIRIGIILRRLGCGPKDGVAPVKE